MNNEIAVVGGGAAGMMAAIAAAERGARVTLLEPNERLGKKLNITGKGRCNVTNNCSMEELLANIPRNGRFLWSAFSRFNAQDAMVFFEELGVPLKTERGNRVFPQSDRSFDVSGALERRLRRLHVRIVRDRALSIETEGGAVCAVLGEQARYPAQAVILATGGVSYPATGSTGDGYRMAQALGHMIVPPRGSLVPLESDSPDCAAMQGLALRNVELAVYSKKTKPLFREFGEMLFTHFGVSGPLVLSASAHLRNWDKERYRLVIDLKPALDEQKLESRILRDIAENPNRDMDKILSGLVPRSMVPVVLRRCGLPQPPPRGPRAGGGGGAHATRSAPGRARGRCARRSSPPAASRWARYSLLRWSRSSSAGSSSPGRFWIRMHIPAALTCKLPGQPGTARAAPPQNIRRCSNE